ncbi:protein NRT1/ PTR FAMILY 5.10-like isoform X2 [Silene latifolia]|uniref:protein NRT1/ PTR FAMILY 5.10-like isoform X2 n=1 Tax=Silene latifolia TaxID=37657 RepID=UPI003D785BE0
MDQRNDPTVSGCIDYKRRPALRSKHGKWRSSAFIIGVEMAERLAYFGIAANLIQFLTGKLGQSTATAATNVSTWTGISLLLPIFGALMADSFLGKYYTVVLSSIIYILGLGLLTLTATLPSLGRSIELQSTIFFIALYMVALGQGGHKPCVQAFGADQFDGEDPEERKAKSSFFNWWYCGSCIGSITGTAVMSYTQDNLSWGLGFGIPCILLVVSLLVFMAGTYTYRFSTQREGHSPFRRIGRVIMVAARNWRLPHQDEGLLTTQTYNSKSRIYRFLDKALIEPLNPGEGRACSEKEVEEAKAILRLFPIWAATLLFAMLISQPQTFFIKQGVTLDRSIGSKFEIPPAALTGFIPVCIVLFVPIYDRLIVPLAQTSTGQPAGITMLQRIGAGMLISIVAMVVAALVEMKRLKTASEHGLVDSPKARLPMSVAWLLPQCALFGISDGFTMVGLQEFFYDQVPDELRSVGLGLYMGIFGTGSILSGALISVIDQVTSKDGRQSWFSNNLNQGHLDYFYWLLAGISALGLMLFMYFAKSYIYNKSKARV